MIMRGKPVTIPFRGMNNQLLDDQSLDGLCDSIINLKPKGDTEKPYWAPFEKINPLKNTGGTPFAYTFGMSSITDAFWQFRNFVGEYSDNPTGSLKRLLVLCQNGSRKCIDIIDPTTWAVVKTQALPQEGTYTWSCTRLNETTIIAINRDKKPFVMYYLIDDLFIESEWPEMPAITFSETTASFTASEITAGTTKGVLRESTDQWFLATWAFRLFNGTHIKHNAPILVKVDQGPTTVAVLPVFTLDGYSVAQNLLIKKQFWKGLIAGISVCCTIPRNTERGALDDGAFYEVGFWPYIDKLQASEWPTAIDPNIITVELKSDSWPTGKNLGIDDFSHHNYSAKVVDTYNKRLILGGSALDFFLPKILSNGTQNTVPGGVYSDYMNITSNIGTKRLFYYDVFGNTVSGPSDPAYNYETNFSEFSSQLGPKSGREFKTVSIESYVAGSANINPPGGGMGFPNAFYSANITAGNLVLGINTIETNYAFGGTLNPTADMYLKVTIGPVGGTADETILFHVSPIFGSTFLTFSNIELQSDSVTVTAKIYHKITIKTDSGNYYRISTEDLSNTQTTVTVPELIWYPDRRATNYELIVQSGASFEVAISKQLTQHPESNYSYVRLTTAEKTYTIGASLVMTTQPDITLNDVLQYIPNRIQASLSGNGFIFDPAASYRVGNRESETILGFGVNLNPTSEGQAGQYPVYVFSDKGVFALEQTGDPEIAFGRISPVSNFNGINNPYAITNANTLIIATDNKYIYALAGLESKRIDEAIANDPDYKEYLKQVRIGYHRATDYEEVIFSNPTFDYSLCYNLKYQVWYKATERFKFFFYDYPDLMGLTVDHVLKDFENKDEESPVTWSLTTRVMQYQEPYVYKRLFPSFIRMAVKQPLQLVAENYLPVQIILKGYRDDQTVIYDLHDQTIKANEVYDPRIYTQFGSMYAYRVLMNGTSQHKRAQIQGLDSFIEFRYQETRRRFNRSAQYMYLLGEAQISICNCPAGANAGAYYIHVQPTGVSEVIISGDTHQMGRIPDVTCIEMDGYFFEPPVQVNFTTYEVRIFLDPAIPFKALLT